MKSDLLYVAPSLPGIQALSCENDFSFANHLHNGHVLWVNSGGGERFSVGGHQEILQPGCVSVIEPGVVHANGPFGEGNRHLRSLYVDQTFFSYLGALYTGSGGESFALPTAVLNHRGCWREFVLLHEAVIRGAEQMEVEQLVLSLFTRLSKIQSENPFTASEDGSRDGRLSELIAYMSANLADQLSLKDLAAILGCTPYHIIRVFKTEKGMSPHAYLVQLRLEAAKAHLDKGLGISEAALLAGFSDQSHLTRNFKRRYGLTPGVYLQQHGW